MPMARKRRVGYSSDDLSLCAERYEMMKLTRMAKAWDFTCSFCFKKFPSAQSMGGHQNAHRSERMEERRLYVRDPIGYRKRAYLKALKERSSPDPHAAGQDLDLKFLDPPKVRVFPASPAAPNRNYFRPPLKIYAVAPKVVPVVPVVVVNFLPPKELSLVEGLGASGQDAKGKAPVETDVGLDSEKKLDLSLKL